MTPNTCFYCFDTDGLDIFEISHCLGLKACCKCYGSAIRDSNAFMHREGLVPLKYAMKHAELSKFTEALLPSFPVRRSNGFIEGGWSLYAGYSRIPKFIVYDAHSQNWLIPVNKGELSKSIRIDEFLKGDILYSLPIGMKGIIENTIAVLDRGVYLADSNLHNSVVNIRAPMTIPEISNIEHCMIDGVVGRVLDLS